MQDTAITKGGDEDGWGILTEPRVEKSSPSAIDAAVAEHRDRSTQEEFVQHQEVESMAIQTQDEDRKQRIRRKNRRKIYLDSHPSYFSNPDLELAGKSLALSSLSCSSDYLFTALPHRILEMIPAQNDAAMCWTSFLCHSVPGSSWQISACSSLLVVSQKLTRRKLIASRSATV